MEEIIDSFLKPHPAKQREQSLDNQHVIVDIDDWRKALLNRQYEEAFNELYELVNYAHDLNILKLEIKTLLKKYNLKYNYAENKKRIIQRCYEENEGDIFEVEKDNITPEGDEDKCPNETSPFERARTIEFNFEFKITGIAGERQISDL